MINPLVDSLLIVAVIAVLLAVAVKGDIRGLFVPSFERRPLLNKSETRLYWMVRKELPRGWTVMAQVSYGAFLGNRSAKRYWTVNAKRADLVVIDPAMNVAAVIEYQGRGHYGNSLNSRSRAKKSDRVKRRATSEARIAFLEIPARFEREFVADLLRRVVEAKGVTETPVAA